jgi:5-methylcytosine-specific restriction endonuclease McrA
MEEKCQELSFEDFSHWRQNVDKKCFYCDLAEDQMRILWSKDLELTKRTRGLVLEIDRVSPNKNYFDFKNLVSACYWCNNAKTDTFTGEEFRKVGKVFVEIWRERLK